MDLNEISRNGSLLRRYAYDAFGDSIGQDIYGFEADNGIPETAGQKPQNAERQMHPFYLDLNRSEATPGGVRLKNKIDILFFINEFIRFAIIVPAAAYNKKLTLFVVENRRLWKGHGY